MAPSVDASRRWLLSLVILLGLVLGIGGFTFRYAEGLSYFSTDPKACVNCHIMAPQYDSWLKSSHHAVATCVDCHLPHDFVGKYIAKAENGYHHSEAFTTQAFHEPIQITPKNARILQHNCVDCHAEMVHGLLREDSHAADAVDCVHCHATVGHGMPPTGIGGADRGEEHERNSHGQSAHD